MILNTSVPVPVSPLVRPSATVETTTIVGAADNMDALAIASLLTTNRDVRQWTFRTKGVKVACSWGFTEIVKNKSARVFEGTIMAGEQTRQVRLIIATDQALETAQIPTDAVWLNPTILGAGCRHTGEHAFLRLLTTVFCREQQPQIISSEGVVQHLAA